MSSDLRPKRNSDLVARLANIQIYWPAQRSKKLNSDLRPRGSSDFVAGLDEIQI